MPEEIGTNGVLAALVPGQEKMLAQVREALVEKRRLRDHIDAEIEKLEHAEQQLENLFAPSARTRAPRAKPDLMAVDADMTQSAFRFLVEKGLNKQVRSSALNDHFKPPRKVYWTRVLSPLIRTGHVAAFGKGPGQSFCALKDALG